MRLLACLLIWSASGLDAVPLQFKDLTPALKVFLPGIDTAAQFDALRQRLLLETDQRLQDGDREALVYYVLQAKRFTSVISVEPARAAREFVERGTIALQTEQRIAAFASACEEGRTDERLRYFCAASDNGRTVRPSYSRAMRFLYDKEFRSQAKEGDQRREFVASLYRTRGFSTDTSFDANFPVYVALRGLAAQASLHVERVLIVGPGLDLAPRTGLNDALPPQSLQPYAVADALLQLKVAVPSRLRIDCVDVNQRVVEYFNGVRPSRLTIVARSGTEEYRRYYNDFGQAIGKAISTGPVKTIALSAEVAGIVSAERLNILTELQNAAYDLIIATNVLVYFNTQEVALAFANLHYMLRDGGYFVHNDLRGEIDPIGRAVQMPVVNARMLRVREDERAAIFDGYVVHKKDSQI